MVKKKVWIPKECKGCGKMFTPWNTPQNFCGNPCKKNQKYTIEEANKKWLERDANKKDVKRYNFGKVCFTNSGTRVI